jgi:hypothetical protein
VRFDLVTARFARPWFWREPSCAPLYAGGAEFGFTEAAWEQGLGCSRGVERDGSAPARRQYHVPDFVHAAHALLQSDGWGALPEDERVAALAQAAGGLSRYCSLNLCTLASYGTVEVRRFHGTLDAPLVVRWAHFCVAFVETFAAAPWPLLEQPPADALRELQRAQEAATADELMARMEGRVDPRTAAYFMRDAGSAPTRREDGASEPDG